MVLLVVVISSLGLLTFLESVVVSDVLVSVVELIAHISVVCFF